MKSKSKKVVKKVKKQKPALNLEGFQVVNHDKLHRAIYGTVGRGGQMVGGVGEAATPMEVLAEYDRLGGLVLDKEGNKLETGSFYDFKGRKPLAKALPKKEKKVNKKGMKVQNEGDELENDADEDLEDDDSAALDEEELDDNEEEEEL